MPIFPGRRLSDACAKPCLSRLRGDIAIPAVFLLLAGLAALWLNARMAHAGTPTRETVLAAMGRDDLRGEASLNLQIEPWKPSPGAFAALISIDAGGKWHWRRPLCRHWPC